MSETTTTTTTGRRKKAGNPPPTNETAQQKKARLLGGARSAAVTQLIEKHRKEFNDLVQAEAKKVGVDWKPQPTKEEKALAQAQALIADNPGLLEQLKAAQAGG